MFLWPLVVGPIVTAVILLCATLRFSSLTIGELWAKLSQLTKIFVVIAYFSLVVLWLGVVYLTSKLIAECQHLASVYDPI